METQTSQTSTADAMQTASASDTLQAGTVAQDRNYGWDNVREAEGIPTSIFGMLIVFTGLILTFCYITLLPKIVGERNAKVKKTGTTAPDAGTVLPQDAASADGSLSPELQAVIAFVIAAEQEYEQLTDYTKLTIRRDENQQAWGVAGKMRTLATRKLN